MSEIIACFLLFLIMIALYGICDELRLIRKLMGKKTDEQTSQYSP